MRTEQRYCRHRSPEDRAATLIRIKDQQLKNFEPTDHLSTLQAVAAMLELDRKIVALGYEPSFK